eukprot:CAMPEP_0181383810 /NCGR_PEP_ID=MMETSP1106-20121128/21583_1 /TAXON_ID=81844 /ORGANISM="Mantoniella antarctica, Strain SL-175" /LENGTH=68 /DNA_ID=CAMNT_0023503545 /DNA_START=81 /DNA_END=284 /DNA_ORIENTATION=+
MMPSSSTPAPRPGWVFDGGSGYYHNPASGVYFDQQRSLYHAGGRWLSHAEYTSMFSTSTTAPAHVVHP